MKKRNILEISCAEIFIISLQKELHLGYIYIKETENKSHSISKKENTHPLYTIFIDEHINYIIMLNNKQNIKI